MGYLLMILGVMMFFVGLPASIIVTIVFVKNRKKVTIPALCIPGSLFLMFIFVGIGAWMVQPDQDTAENTEIDAQEESKEILNMEAQKQNTETEKEESEKEEIQKETEKKEEPEKQEEIESIFYGEIGLNKEFYMGKEVAFSFKCEFYDDDDEIEELSTESNLCYGSVEVQFQKSPEVENGEYITVKGSIGEDHGSTVLNDTVIICKGSEAEDRYNKELELWEQSFYNADSVSYEDLLRYPDSYNNQKVKIELDIEDVESDGIIFNGTIKGVVPGTENEVALYDYRENREPRVQEGDKLVVYGVGNKTLTVKVKEKSGIFSKTIDEYEVPCLYIQYIDFR